MEIWVCLVVLTHPYRAYVYPQLPGPSLGQTMRSLACRSACRGQAPCGKVQQKCSTSTSSAVSKVSTISVARRGVPRVRDFSTGRISRPALARLPAILTCACFPGTHSSPSYSFPSSTIFLNVECFWSVICSSVRSLARMSSFFCSPQNNLWKQ